MSELVPFQPSRDVSTLIRNPQFQLLKVMKSLNLLIEIYNHAGRQYKKQRGTKRLRQRKFSSRSSSSEDGYVEILLKKEIFVKKLFQALKRSRSFNNFDIAKLIFMAYYQGANLIHKHIWEVEFETKYGMYQMKELKTEASWLDSQLEVFSKIELSEAEDPEVQIDFKFANEYRNAKNDFTDAKNDLETVMEILFPDEEDRNQLKKFLLELVDAYTTNPSDKSNQFVYLSEEDTLHQGLQWLIDGYVIIEHPSRPNMYRLSVD